MALILPRYCGCHHAFCRTGPLAAAHGITNDTSLPPRRRVDSRSLRGALFLARLACRDPRVRGIIKVVEARHDSSGSIVFSMSQAEAIVLHEAIAFAEWSNELTRIELRGPVERKVASDVQQALVPLIPDLGTDSYARTVEAALKEIDSSHS